MVWVLTATILAVACHSRDAAPTAPSDRQSGDTPAQTLSKCATTAPYTISGIITGYQAGPLGGIHIEVAPYPYGFGTETRTDATGRYSVCGPPAAKVGVQLWGAGYATAFKYDLPPRDQTIDLVLRPRYEVPVAGGVVEGIIRGDEAAAGDDDFGGVCVRAVCRIVDFSYAGCPCPGRAEITLRWADPDTHLALYISNTDIYFPPASVPPARRYCCTSPLVATYVFNADFDRFAIGLEQSGGRPPGPNDSQAFELTIRRLS